MDKILRFITTMLIITLIFTQVAFAEETNGTISFSDLDETYWAYESIDKLVEAGYIVGYPDGSFQPDGDITRAELIKISNQVFSYIQKQEFTNFTDIKSDDWFYENVLIAQKAGYINGYPDGTFNPNGLITRQELCKILNSINNFVELPYENSIVDEVSTWAVEYVNKVVSNRIMLLDEKNNFRATEKATRAEVCDALAKFILIEEEPIISPGGNSIEIPVVDDTEQELYDAMDRVIEDLKDKVIPELSADQKIEKDIINEIIVNMNEYKKDNTYNYKKSAEETYKSFKLLDGEAQDALSVQIMDACKGKDIYLLKDFFFPNADL